MQPCNRQTLKRILLTTFTALFLLTQTAQSASRYVFIHTDMLGSPMATTDENGNIISRENVTPYGDSLGKQDSTNGVAVGNPEHGLGYTGHVRDNDLGLTYMQARYYDPTVGRFMGADPVGFLDNESPTYFNRYAYAGNNPYRYVDPDGREIRLQTHPVLLGGRHSKLVITPDLQGKYMFDDRFQQRHPDGRVFTTVGAGPVPLLIRSKLVSAADRPTDLVTENNTHDEALSDTQRGRSDSELIERLLGLHKNYKNNLNYDLSPEHQNGYNSNSYISGLLNATGISVDPPDNVPGWDTPEPESEFKDNGTQCIP